MKRDHLWLLAGLFVFLAALLAPAAGLAAGREPEGYCTADGQPVVTYWPPGRQGLYIATCTEGRISFAAKLEHPLNGPDPSPGGVTLERPDDWGRWVFLQLNGNALVNPYGDTAPYVVKSTGRTLVPLRFVTEAFGAPVSWNGETRTVTFDWRGRQIKVVVGGATAWVDGREVMLDQPAVLWKDRTMVPLRFLVESFGATVAWDEPGSQVLIDLTGVTCPPTYCVRQTGAPVVN